MAQGSSGRIVIDIDPTMKRMVYDAIRSQGGNMRQWFLTMVQREFDLSENINDSEHQASERFNIVAG